MTHSRFHRSGSRPSCVASQAVGCGKVRLFSTAFPSSKITIVGGPPRPAIVTVWSRASRSTRRVTSPAAVPTRTTSGMWNTGGIVNLRPVLSGLSESSCVCLMSSVSACAVESYVAATSSCGYPAWYTHSLQNRSRFSPVAATNAWRRSSLVATPKAWRVR